MKGQRRNVVVTLLDVTVIDKRERLFVKLNPEY